MASNEFNMMMSRVFGGPQTQAYFIDRQKKFKEYEQALDEYADYDENSLRHLLLTLLELESDFNQISAVVSVLNFRYPK